MKALFKKAKDRDKAAAAMLQMFEQTGALDSKTTQRGAKFIKKMIERAYGETREGLEPALRQGVDNIDKYLTPQARQKRKQMKQEMKHYNEARLMSEIKQDEELSRLSERIFGGKQ